MNLLKFDRTRNALEMGELVPYIVCLAIGGVVAAVLGISLVVAFVVVVWAFKMWGPQKKVITSRIRLLAILASLLLLLLENWSAYCDGFSKGREAAEMIGSRTTHQSVTLEQDSGQRV